MSSRLAIRWVPIAPSRLGKLVLAAIYLPPMFVALFESGLDILHQRRNRAPPRYYPSISSISIHSQGYQHSLEIRSSSTFSMPGVLNHSVVTEVPGPLSKASSKKLNTVFDARAVNFVVDYEKSSGN